MKNSSNQVFWLQILNYETCVLCREIFDISEKISENGRLKIERVETVKVDSESSK